MPPSCSMTAGPLSPIRACGVTINRVHKSGGDAHPAERSDRAGDDADHRSKRAQIQYGGADLGDGVEPQVGFLQPDTAGLEQDDRGGRRSGPRVGGGQQQCLGDLGAGHLAGAAALEALLDRGHHDRAAVDGAAGDDGAVIGLRA